MPQITIQICTYNRANYIEKSIQSVLNQTYTDWELLLFDDASTDNTEEIIKKYLQDTRIKYFKNETNIGITKNRNKSLSHSLGKYIAILDSDDYWIDNKKLEKQISFLENNTDFVAVGTQIHIIDEKDTIVKIKKYPTSWNVLHTTLLLKNYFCHSSMVYRKKEIMESGLYDKSLPIWEDYDLWLRLGTKYKLANLKDYTTAYRLHNVQSNTNKKYESLLVLDTIIEKYKNYYPFHKIALLINTLRKIKCQKQ